MSYTRILLELFSKVGGSFTQHLLFLLYLYDPRVNEEYLQRESFTCVQ